MSTPLPWARWYPRDLLSGLVAHGLTLEQVGLYFVLLAIQDANDGLPLDPKDICSRIPCKVNGRALARVLELYFPVAEEGDCRRNVEFDAQRAMAAVAHERAVRGGQLTAKKRWGSASAEDDSSAKSHPSRGATSSPSKGASSSASSSPYSNQNQTPPPSRISPGVANAPPGERPDATAVGRGGWPARIAKIFADRIGVVSPSECGAHFTDAVATHGVDAVLRGVALWAEQAPLSEKPQFLTPKFCARQIGAYIQRTKPVQLYDEHNQLTAEGARIVGRAAT